MIFTLTTASVAEAGHTGDKALVERAFGDSDPQIRRASLGSFHRLEILDETLIRSAFADSDVSVRCRAAELSHRIAGPEPLLGDLVALLDDEPQVAEIAAFALGEIGDASVAPALESVARNHDDPLCRESAVAALGALHTGLDTILFALDDKATVRRRAIIALAPFDGPLVDAALERALEDRDWQVRQAAEDQIA